MPSGEALITDKGMPNPWSVRVGDNRVSLVGADKIDFSKGFGLIGVESQIKAAFLGAKLGAFAVLDNLACACPTVLKGQSPSTKRVLALIKPPHCTPAAYSEDEQIK